MKLFSGPRANWTPVISGLLIFLCSLAVTGLRTYREYSLHNDATLRELTNKANEKKAMLQSTLRQADMASSVISYFATKQGIKSDISDVAGRVLQLNSVVDLVGLVQGSAVTQVFPWKGNERLLGANIFGEQNGVSEILKNLRPGAGGIYDLLQDSPVLFACRPVYSQGKLNGATIVRIRPAAIFNDSTDHPQYRYQISRTDPKTGKERFYLPYSGSFDKPSSAAAVKVQGGWTIYVVPAKSDTVAHLLPFVLLSLLLSCFAGVAGWYVAIQPSQLKKLVEEKTYLMGLSEGKYQSLFEQASDAILVHDADLNIITVNNAMVSMFGYTTEQLLHMKAVDLFNPETLQQEPLSLGKVIGGKQVIKNRRMLKSDGTGIDVEANAKQVSDGNIMVILRDVTELKEAERLIAHNEITLRNAFEYSAIGMAIVSLEGTWVSVNRELCYMLGYSEKELLALSVQDITHPDDILDGQEFIKGSLISTLERYHVEKRYIHKNGPIVWVNVNSNIIRNEEGAPLHFVTQIENITKKKESDLNFRLLVEQSLAGVYIIQEGKFAYVNPRFAEIFGYDQAELIDTFPAITVVHPEDIPVVENHLRSRAEGATAGVHYEVRGKKKDGEIIWIEVYGSGTIYKGTPAVIGTLQDVTERKRSAAIILHEKNLSEAIINGLPGLFYVWEKNGTLLRWNKNLETITGYDAAEIETMQTSDFVAESQTDFINTKRTEASLNGKASGEVKIITRDGQELIYFITIIPISYNNKDCILGIGIDYTEKKASEITLTSKNAEIKERIKELQCLYRLSEISNDASYSLDDIFKECVRIIPSSYQYPEITCAQIEVGDDVYTSESFEVSTSKQEAALTINGQSFGRISVYYKEDRPAEKEGPFLTEERYLIESAADILSSTIMRRISGDEFAMLNGRV